MARILCVLPDGPGDAPTIQTGIDSLSVGDTVLVASEGYSDFTHTDPYGERAWIIMLEGVCLRSESGDPSCVTIEAEEQTNRGGVKAMLR
jgi:hypothetical protein